MTWTAPLTKKGQPCKKCKPGRLCRTPSHRSGSKKRTGNGGPRPKLTRAVLDTINELAPHASGHEELWTAAGVHPATWFRWLDQGETDTEKNRVTPEREIYESVRNHRRTVARRLAGAAIEAALGHRSVIKDPKTGKLIGIYHTPPDGRLASKLATRLDPSALPPERVELAGAEGGPIKVHLVDVSKLPPPRRDDLADPDDDDDE